MKSIFKRLLAVGLVFLIVIHTFPISSFAAEIPFQAEHLNGTAIDVSYIGDSDYFGPRYLFACEQGTGTIKINFPVSDDAYALFADVTFNYVIDPFDYWEIGNTVPYDRKSVV